MQPDWEQTVRTLPREVEPRFDAAQRRARQRERLAILRGWTIVLACTALAALAVIWVLK